MKVAILGFGVVGSGTAEVITKNRDIIKKKTGADIEIAKILDLRDFEGSPFASLITHNFDEILADDGIDTVIECMGGAHPAFDFSKAALEKGKNVVTSNKLVVAEFGTSLLETAKKHGARYLFEASVGGGIPIIKPLMSDLAQNRTESISGILNGTTNYILTEISEKGTSFEDALRAAQANGYAEADPTADIEGHDAARKIVILAALAYGKLIPPSKIHTEGITKIASEDVLLAGKRGYTIKLIGHAEEDEKSGKILAFVAPRLVPRENPLHDVSDVFNGILVSCDMLGDAMFYGRGAGKLPTASAVVSDVIDIAVKDAKSAVSAHWTNAAESDIADFNGYICRRFVRLARPTDISAIFPNADIISENAFITEPISEKEFRETVSSHGLDIASHIRTM